MVNTLFSEVGGMKISTILCDGLLECSCFSKNSIVVVGNSGDLK